MLWHKEKIVFAIKGGRAQALTNPIHGLIQHIIVLPKSDTTIWSMKLIDPDHDVLVDIIDHKGRLDDRQSTPVGKDQRQRHRIVFDGVTSNEPITVILKVREDR